MTKAISIRRAAGRTEGPTPLAGEEPTDGRAAPLPGFSARPVAAVAVCFFALEMVVSARYGIHRDELYFLACARHLAWGYVDQPPLVPAVAHLVNSVVGPSVVGLRLLPAIAGAVTAVLSALMARELGGGRAAQVIAAVASATSAQVLAAFHLLSTAAFDMFFWALATFLVVRLLRTGDRRWWLAIGAVVGVALLNKLNVAFLAFAVVGGLLVTRRAEVVLNRWFAAAVVIATAIASPDVAWNATHNWAQLSMLHALHRENSTLSASVLFVPAQLVVPGPVLALVWIPGLVRLARHPVGRPMAAAYLILLVVYTVSGAKPYYMAGIYFVLFAGGGVSIEEKLSTRVTSRGYGRLVAVALCGVVLALPLTLPVLPQSALPTGGWESNINKDLSATVGWKAAVRQIAAAAATVPPAQRGRLVVLTGDYGAAGAVDLYGGAMGLPRAISGHNNYWWWGFGPVAADSTTIAVNMPEAQLAAMFASVRLAGRVRTPQNVWSEERGDPIWVCTGQRVDWSRAWPSLRDYG